MALVKMLRDFKVAVSPAETELWLKDSEHEVSDALAFDLEEGLVAVPVTGNAKADEKAVADASAELAAAQKAEAEELAKILAANG